MTSYQLADHLPVDPTRLYYEISLHWVFWYVGVPAVILATLGAAVLARRCVRGRAPGWTLPLVSFAWIIVATLLRPGITPDQPWASRRLVPGVLPGFIVLALWAASWLTGWLREHGTGRAIRGCAVTVLSAALVLPAVITTFGISYQDGPGGFGLVADGFAGKTTYAGEIGAVRRLCAAVPADASVVLVTATTAGQLAPVLRAMCGVPAATMLHQPRAVMRQVARGIRAAGRRPVILARTRRQVLRYAARPRQVVALRVQVDDHALTAPPRATLPLAITVWMGLPP